MKSVIFDIDGTLTPRPDEFLEVRPNAANFVRKYANDEYMIIYLSARFDWFEGLTKLWLKEKGFPEGLLSLADTIDDVVYPDIFKTRCLKSLQQCNFKFIAAYGDSTTDFIAYTNVGIPKAQIFALKREGDLECQPGVYSECMNGFTGPLFE